MPDGFDVVAVEIRQDAIHIYDYRH